MRAGNPVTLRPPLAWVRCLGPLVAAELRQRYAGSVLGGLWAVAGPLVEVAAYAAVFGLMLKRGHDGLAFGLFVASGLLPWAALREALEGSAGLLPEHRWLRRSLVPMDLLVARLVSVTALRGAAGLLLVFGIAAATGRGPGLTGLGLALFALYLQTVATYGLGLLVAPLATLQPDLRPGLASALTLATFASPIVYPESLLTPSLRALVEWNPFTHYLRLYRLAVAPADGALGAASLAVVLALPVVLLALGTLAKERLLWPARDRL